MSPLPTQFTGRWDNLARPSYRDAVCWHLLLGGHAPVRAAAEAARRRLARFPALHMTPPQWLHMTVLRVGTSDLVSEDDMARMIASAQAGLSRVGPVTVTLRRVFYHPEAIGLIASPGSALAPILAAARAATREVLGPDSGDRDPHEWAPHLTLCYSTASQPAAPVIAEFGRTLPPCEVTVGEISLVVQDGAEDQWNWRVAGTARLRGDA
jgi:2'-5' RNA ligase